MCDFNTHIFTDLATAQQHYAQVFYTEFHPITKEIWKYW